MAASWCLPSVGKFRCADLLDALHRQGCHQVARCPAPSRQNSLSTALARASIVGVLCEKTSLVKVARPRSGVGGAGSTFFSTLDDETAAIMLLADAASIMEMEGKDLTPEELISIGSAPMSAKHNKTVRCAIYARVSTDQGLEQDLNPERIYRLQDLPKAEAGQLLAVQLTDSVGAVTECLQSERPSVVHLAPRSHLRRLTCFVKACSCRPLAVSPAGTKTRTSSFKQNWTWRLAA